MFAPGERHRHRTLSQMPRFLSSARTLASIIGERQDYTHVLTDLSRRADFQNGVAEFCPYQERGAQSGATNVIAVRRRAQTGYRAAKSQRRLISISAATASQCSTMSGTSGGLPEYASEDYRPFQPPLARHRPENAAGETTFAAGKHFRALPACERLVPIDEDWTGICGNG
jgi:hypothetical protein